MGKIIWFIISWAIMSMLLLAGLSRRRGRGDGSVWYDYRKKPATWKDAVAMVIIAGVIAWLLAPMK